MLKNLLLKRQELVDKALRTLFRYSGLGSLTLAIMKILKVARFKAKCRLVNDTNICQ